MCFATSLDNGQPCQVESSSKELNLSSKLNKTWTLPALSLTLQQAPFQVLFEVPFEVPSEVPFVVPLLVPLQLASPPTTPPL